MIPLFLFFTLFSPLCRVVQAQEQRCCQQAADGPVCFNRGPPFAHLPLPNCPEALRISMQVFTRNNRDNGQSITRTTIPPAFQEAKRTAVISHGWLGEGRDGWMDDLRNKILNRVDWNVIQVGWPEGSQNLWYPQSASDTRAVGTEIGIRVRNLVQSAGARREDFWCLGHSLGGHVCGHAGKRYKMGRITGMDPAGPLFDEHDINCGLMKNDGDLVDVIHTHGSGGIIINLGTLRPLGHVDFYPNGGRVQPGCINLGEPNPYVVCSHFRAIDFVEEAFESTTCVFNSRQQCSDERDLPDSCTDCGGVCQAMGMETENYPGRGLFYLTTREDPPFCRG